MTQHKNLSLVLTVRFFSRSKLSHAVQLICSERIDWSDKKSPIWLSTGGRGGKRGGTEEATLLIKDQRWGRGGGDKELFWASGNGELSEQKGSWQSRSDQGVFKVPPTLIFSSRPRWWNREAFCESPRQTLHVRGTIQALKSLVRWLNRQSQAGRRWRQRWSRGQACPPWSPPPSPPWLSHSSQFNHRPKTSPQMESKECNLYQNLCKWLPFPRGVLATRGILKCREGSLETPSLTMGEKSKVTNVSNFVWDFVKDNYGQEVQRLK